MPIPPRLSRRSPSRWWRLAAPPADVLEAELDAAGDARVAADWLLAQGGPVELAFVLGNAGRWAGLRLGLTGFGATEAAARAACRGVAAGLDDAPAAFGWALVRCEPPGPLPAVALPLGLPAGHRLERRDGVFDHTRARLCALARQERTTVLRLGLRLDPGPAALRQDALDLIGRALRAARPSRSGPPRAPLALAERARDLHADAVGLQAEVSVHVDAVPGPLGLARLRADLAADLGRRVRWDQRGPVSARPELLPAALALLGVPAAADRAPRVVALRA
jgi:hypothetical protein